MISFLTRAFSAAFLSSLLVSFALYAEDSPIDPTQNLNAVQKEDSLTELSPPARDLDVKAPEELTKPKKSEFITMTLASLFPGLGHIYLNDLETAGRLIGTSGVSMGISEMSKSNGTLNTTSLVAMQNTWLYGMYAAYRDVRSYNGPSGYKYAMPVESFSDLTRASFEGGVLKKPEVWGGVLGFLTLGICVSYFNMPTKAQVVLASQEDKIDIAKVSPISAFPIGIGEEAFFRGYLQSSFAESLTPTGSIVATSLIFGAAHLPNALSLPKEDRLRYCTTVFPLITTMGGYLGWLTHKNQSLKESVAVHAWYDFMILLAVTLARKASSANSAAMLAKPQFALSVEF